MAPYGSLGEQLYVCEQSTRQSSVYGGVLRHASLRNFNLDYFFDDIWWTLRLSSYMCVIKPSLELNY